MRRGFKTWCETTAERYRAALRQKLEERLDPETLAAHLGVVLWRPEEIPGLSERSLLRLTKHDSGSWSAVTIRVGDRNVTIINSSHAPTRRRSSLTHELAHVILDHEPSRIDLSPAGHLLLSSFEREQEEEADWLSATLLVPRAGLVIAYRSTQAPDALAKRFAVSEDLLKWRLRMTGVAMHARRTRTWSRTTAKSRG